MLKVLLWYKMVANSSNDSSVSVKHSVPSASSSCTGHTKNVLDVSVGRIDIVVGITAKLVLKSVAPVGKN